MSSTSAPPRANPPAWSAPDSLGVSIWNRTLRPASAALGATPLVVPAVTAIHDRHMSFLDALTVRAGGGEAASARGGDARVFRSLGAATRAVVVPVARRAEAAAVVAVDRSEFRDDQPPFGLSSSKPRHPGDGTSTSSVRTGLEGVGEYENLPLSDSKSTSGHSSPRLSLSTDAPIQPLAATPPHAVADAKAGSGSNAIPAVAALGVAKLAARSVLPGRLDLPARVTRSPIVGAIDSMRDGAAAATMPRPASGKAAVIAGGAATMPQTQPATSASKQAAVPGSATVALSRFADNPSPFGLSLSKPRHPGDGTLRRSSGQASFLPSTSSGRSEIQAQDDRKYELRTVGNTSAERTDFGPGNLNLAAPTAPPMAFVSPPVLQRRSAAARAFASGTSSAPGLARSAAAPADVAPAGPLLATRESSLIHATPAADETHDRAATAGLRPSHHVAGTQVRPDAGAPLIHRDAAPASTPMPASALVMKAPSAAGEAATGGAAVPGRVAVGTSTPLGAEPSSIANPAAAISGTSDGVVASRATSPSDHHVAATPSPALPSALSSIAPATAASSPLSMVSAAASSADVSRMPLAMGSAPAANGTPAVPPRVTPTAPAPAPALAQAAPLSPAVAVARAAIGVPMPHRADVRSSQPASPEASVARAVGPSAASSSPAVAGGSAPGVGSAGPSDTTPSRAAADVLRAEAQGPAGASPGSSAFIARSSISEPAAFNEPAADHRAVGSDEHRAGRTASVDASPTAAPTASSSLDLPLAYTHALGPRAAGPALTASTVASSAHRASSAPPSAQPSLAGPQTESRTAQGTGTETLRRQRSAAPGAVDTTDGAHIQPASARAFASAWPRPAAPQAARQTMSDAEANTVPTQQIAAPDQPHLPLAQPPTGASFVAPSQPLPNAPMPMHQHVGPTQRAEAPAFRAASLPLVSAFNSRLPLAVAAPMRSPAPASSAAPRAASPQFQLQIDRALTPAGAPHELLGAAPMAAPPAEASAAPTHRPDAPPAGAQSQAIDVDEIVERAWQAVMSRLAIEQERRGYARWA